MSDDPSNGVSIRDHIEQIFVRFESTVKEQINALREDVKHLQNNYVTRSEFDLKNSVLEREIQRLDRDQREGFKVLDDEVAGAIEDLKEDIRADRNRTLAIAGFCIGVFEFALKFVAN